MKKYMIYGMALLVLIFIAGCVASGTLILVYDIDSFISSSTSIQVTEVDLTDNSDYNDHKDKIKSIDQVAVVGTLENLEFADNQAEVWLSDVGTYSSPAEVRANATIVFSSPVILAGDTLFIDWSDALSYIQNLQTLKDAADNGHFYLYGLAENSPFSVRFQISLVITMTAGL